MTIDVISADMMNELSQRLTCTIMSLERKNVSIEVPHLRWESMFFVKNHLFEFEFTAIPVHSGLGDAITSFRIADKKQNKIRFYKLVMD